MRGQSLTALALVVVFALAGCADDRNVAEMPDARPPSCELEASFFYQLEVDGFTWPDAIRVSLQAYCAEQEGSCPMRDAVQHGPIRVTGCGVESFQWRVGTFYARQWNYDVETGELIGAGLRDDVRHIIGGCEGVTLQAGQGPPFGLDSDSDGGQPIDPPPHRELCGQIEVSQ